MLYKSLVVGWHRCQWCHRAAASNCRLLPTQAILPSPGSSLNCFVHSSSRKAFLFVRPYHRPLLSPGSVGLQRSRSRSHDRSSSSPLRGPLSHRVPAAVWCNPAGSGRNHHHTLRLPCGLRVSAGLTQPRGLFLPPIFAHLPTLICGREDRPATPHILTSSRHRIQRWE